MIRRKTTFLLTGLLSVVLQQGQAQEAPRDSGSFFVRLGTDTIAIERYRRTKFQLTGEALMRTPMTRHITLTVTFRDDGGIGWWEVVNSPVAGVPNSPPVLRILATPVRDSVQVLSWVGGELRDSKTIAAHPDMVPLQIPFYSTYELALQRARRSPGDTILNMLAANAPLQFTVSRITSDSLTLYHPQSGLNVVRLDSAGRLLRFNGEATTFKVLVTRSRPVDLQPWSVRFAKADAEGKSIGALSPRGGGEFAVGNNVLMLEYSRPARRGRVIFGGVVPWDSVWRTGANAATHLILAQPIIVNGTEVPAGKYTLWTIPSRNSWQIIINKQTGQWGTMYDPAHDLVRAPARVETHKEPVERFTIDIADKGELNGELILSWDRTKVVLPFKVKE